jgi:ribonuclease HI
MFADFESDISIFGKQIEINLPNFKRIHHKKNPYIFGEVEYEGNKFTVYLGKNGISIVPFDPELFLDLILSIRVSAGKGEKKENKGEKNESGIFVDGNEKGFCILWIENGRIQKIFLCENDATANKNELLAILLAHTKFKDKIKKEGVKICSDSSFAINKAKKLYNIDAEKVRAHSGNLWNTVADALVKNVKSFAKMQEKGKMRVEFINLKLWLS